MHRRRLATRTKFNRTLSTPRAIRQGGQTIQMQSSSIEPETSPVIIPTRTRLPPHRRRRGSPNTWLHTRVPRTDDASYFDRLVCYLLNKLQEPLQPRSGQSKDFFRKETARPRVLCGHVGSIIADSAVRVGLDAFAYIKHIDFEVTSHKRRLHAGGVVYALRAGVRCFRWDGEEVEIFGGEPERLVEAEVTAEWMDDGSGSGAGAGGSWDGAETGNMWDRLTFERALLLLRRAAKEKFDRFGVRRSPEEAQDSPVLAGKLTLWGLMPGQKGIPFSGDREVSLSGHREVPSSGDREVPSSRDRDVVAMHWRLNS
ncbi:hypothetical protein IFR05_006145 [Cadophora sp. M221]|nr:hypothetical protein IFR05_006145 [Cadophora sp. M221]